MNAKNRLFFSIFSLVVLCAISVNASETLIYVPDDYAKIQWAVDNATDNDIIIVRDGTYIENVDVHKPLKIISEMGPDTAIVQAAVNESFCNVFTINKENVIISGFTIEGATGTFGAGISIKPGADHAIIENNIISNNHYSVDSTFSDNNIITNNQINGGDIDLFSESNNITNNKLNKSSIRLSGDSNNLINNVISNGDITIFSHSDNLIMNNVISNGDITIFSHSDNLIMNNVISKGGIRIHSSDNLVSNITFHYGGLCIGSTGNTVENCTVNGKPLMYLENKSALEIDGADVGQIILVDCQYMIIRNCTITNTSPGINLHKISDSLIENNTLQNNGCGIFMDESTDNIIRKNIFKKNYCGIWVSQSLNNTLQNNSLYSNVCGIDLVNYAQHNIVEYNDINNNTYPGISIRSSQYNMIKDNRINDNGYGIYTGCSTIYVVNGYETPIISKNNTIVHNDIKRNKIGIHLWSFNNSIYLNNFDNTINAKAISSNNSVDIWNSPEPLNYTYKGKNFKNYMGNYWSNYTFEGNDTDEDGIGDTIYSLGYEKDYYPLMELYENYQLSIDQTPVANHADRTKDQIIDQIITTDPFEGLIRIPWREVV